MKQTDMRKTFITEPVESMSKAVSIFTHLIAFLLGLMIAFSSVPGGSIDIRNLLFCKPTVV